MDNAQTTPTTPTETTISTASEIVPTIRNTNTSLTPEQAAIVLCSVLPGDELVSGWQESWGIICSFDVADVEGIIKKSALMAGSGELINDMPNGQILDVTGVLFVPVKSVDKQSGEELYFVRVTIMDGERVVHTSSDHARRAIGEVLRFYKGILPARTKWRVVKTKTQQPSPMLSLAYMGPYIETKSKK